MPKNSLTQPEEDFPWFRLTYILYFLAFSYFFAQNFVFSSSFELLHFRGGDDIAFQAYLRAAHEDFELFGLNGYAYGWIYWFPLIVITYPFYLLSIYFGIDMPLLVAPRMLSLFFTLGSAYILYKIARFYTADKFLIALILLLFLSFPGTGFFAMRFGTVAETQFFSALAFYLTISRKIYDCKSIALIGLTTAAAIAVKVSCILIVPIIALILADRLEWKINRENIIRLVLFVIGLTIGFLLLAQPDFKGILHQIQTNHTSYGNPPTIVDNFTKGVAGTSLHPIALIGLFVALLWLGVKEMRKRRDFLFLFFTLLINTLYLIVTIKKGIFYVNAYVPVFIYLALLGTIFLEKFSHPVKIALGIGFFIFNIAANLPNYISEEAQTRWDIHFFHAKDEKDLRLMEVQDKVRTLIKQVHPAGQKLTILRDDDLPEFFSDLHADVENIMLFDDFFKRYKLTKFDFIILSKNNHPFYTKEKFDKFIATASADFAEQCKIDRLFTKDFLKTHILNGRLYRILYEDDLLIVFHLMAKDG